MNGQSTIAAVSTPAGTGGIAVVRISGPDAIEIVGGAWRGKPLKEIAGHTATLGRYVSTSGELIDECLATLFRAPRSFTGEDVVEISVHGSVWIQREIMADLIRRGARAAGPGEFTQRAFLNGRLDLAQAEGVADLIAASSKAAHDLAVSQTRGRFSREFEALRERLIEFASLLELELDFSEEDVEFADRANLRSLAGAILAKVERLADSYASGAVLKDGIPVVIAGIPNAGKSSLLNMLLGEDKAIVTDIPGTTRDVLEDTAEIDGILFRFTDTAGLRESDDMVESIGIERAKEKIRTARIVIWVFDPFADDARQIREIREIMHENPDRKLIVLVNKSDLAGEKNHRMTESPDTDKLIPKTGHLHNEGNDTASLTDGSQTQRGDDADASFESVIKDAIPFSAKTGEGYGMLKQRLKEMSYNGYDPGQELIVTNARHYEALTRGAESLRQAIAGIDSNLSADFIAQDVREALHFLGTITGSVTTPDLLTSIFTHFCIGK